MTALIGKRQMPLRAAGVRATLRAVLAVLALCLAVPAAAHPVPYSYLDLEIGDRRIDGTLTVHLTDIAHELRLADPDSLRDPAVLQGRKGAIEAMLSAHVALGDDAAAPLEWGAATLVDDGDALRFAFRVPQAAPPALAVDTQLFGYDPLHRTFVNIYEDGDLRRQWILGGDSDPAIFYRGTTAGLFAVMETFVPSGIHHILIGPDHLLFLFALLLLGGSAGALVRIVTAFTVGHSITLSLAVLNIVTPPSFLVEPAIALSIVVVGLDNLLRGQGRDVRMWVALLFGLVHGFGFASVLREFGLPQEALGWALFSFNVGVELGQLTVVIVVASALAFIRRRARALARRIVIGGSLVVVAAGLFWFMERTFFPGGY